MGPRPESPICIQRNEQGAQNKEFATKEDTILDLAISYVIQGSYPNQDLSKDKRRAIRKRANSLQVQNGEVFILKKGKWLRVVTSPAGQMMILKPSHSDPTSGRFGVTRTWRRVAERFELKGIVADVNEIVSCIALCISCHVKYIPGNLV